MIKIILNTYVFIRWTGGWGCHSGLGAFFFFILWTAFMAMSVCMAAAGPLLTIVSIGRLFRCDVGNIQAGIVNAVKTPAGQTLLFGHLTTMGLTALVCYFGYFISGSSAPCIFNLSKPTFVEWLVLIWFMYSTRTFFKFLK